MARKPLTLPAALDAYEDAIAGIERRVPKLERAFAALEEVLKQTAPHDALPFGSDLQSMRERLSALKERF